MNDRRRLMRPLFVVALAFLAIAAMVSLTGCAATPPPKTPRQSLAYAEAGFTSAKLTLADLRREGILTPDQIARADRLITRGDTIRHLAEQADAAGDTTTLEGQIDALNALLLELRKMIPEVEDGQ